METDEKCSGTSHVELHFSLLGVEDKADRQTGNDPAQRRKDAHDRVVLFRVRQML